MSAFGPVEQVTECVGLGRIPDGSLAVIDRFRLDPTFTGADVSDRVWSFSTAPPISVKLDCL